jgi:hypothetical protein
MSVFPFVHLSVLRESRSKGKGVVVHSVKACVGSGGIIPLILELRRVVGSTTQLLYHLGRAPGARTGLDALKRRIISAPPPPRRDSNRGVSIVQPVA